MCAPRFETAPLGIRPSEAAGGRALCPMPGAANAGVPRTRYAGMDSSGQPWSRNGSVRPVLAMKVRPLVAVHSSVPLGKPPTNLE